MNKWLDPEEFSDIPDDIREYTPEQHAVMKRNLGYLMIVAVVLALLVLLVDFPVPIAVIVWYATSFLLISKPAIKQQVERDKDNEKTE